MDLSYVCMYVCMYVSSVCKYVNMICMHCMYVCMYVPINQNFFSELNTDDINIANKTFSVCMFVCMCGTNSALPCPDTVRVGRAPRTDRPGHLPGSGAGQVQRGRDR